MPQHVSGRFNFGAALSEDGLNRVSAALRVVRPELFQKSDSILIKPPTGTDPGHTLKITAIVDGSIQFNLFPVLGSPVPEETFFVKAKITFSLTDSLLGLVTRIGLQIEAMGRFIQPISPSDPLVIRLEKRQDGSDYMDIVDIEGLHPNVQLLAGAIDAGAAVGLVYEAGDDSQLGRSFRAIVNYLINLFLRDTLKRTIVEFPVPALERVIEFGPMGKLPIQEIHSRNNSLYVWMGNEEVSTPQPFPDAPIPLPHLRFGISNQGLHRVVDALLPIPIDLPPPANPSRPSLKIYGDGLNIHKILFQLIPWVSPFPAPPGTPQIPGLNNIPTAIFFGGNLMIQVRFSVLGVNIDFDLPIPLDQLSSYWGSFVPVMSVGNLAADQNAIVEARIVPATGFFDAWCIFLITNYRDYFASAIRHKLQEFADIPIVKKFCNIPIIGWLVCGVIKFASYIVEVAAWLTGGVLDLAMSVSLTELINAALRIARLFIEAPSSRLFKLSQAELLEKLGLTISTAQLQVISNGRGGEFTLDASFDATGVPVPPAPPLPTPIQSNPLPPQPLPPEFGEILPEYSPADFQPVFTLPLPTWSAQQTETAVFSVTIEAINQPTVFARLTVVNEPQHGGWKITQTMVAADGSNLMRAFATYDSHGNPLEMQVESNPQHNIMQITKYLPTGYASVEFKRDSTALTKDVLLRGGIGQEFETFWIYRLSRCVLSPVTGLAFARVESSDPVMYANWARQIPVRVTVAAGTKTPPGGLAAIPIWLTTSRDEETDVSFESLQDGSGLLSVNISHHGTLVRLERV